MSCGFVSRDAAVVPGAIRYPATPRIDGMLSRAKETSETPHPITTEQTEFLILIAPSLVVQWLAQWWWWRKRCSLSCRCRSKNPLEQSASSSNGLISCALAHYGFPAYVIRCRYLVR